jgi:F-type H+-transporting ATPase subunit gamma
MAAAGLRQIRRRIRTVTSTRKITRAMELISASRIGKAQVRADAARPYSEKITEVIRNVAASVSGDVQHPLLEERELTNYGIVAITSDRGLAGAYSSNVLRIAERRIRELRPTTQSQRAFVIGRKGLSYLRYRNYDVARNFLGISDQPTFADAAAVAKAVMESYVSGEVDRVDLVYTRFISMGTQQPALVQVLPVPVGEVTGRGDGDAPAAGPQASYEFEPSPEEILGRLLPSYVESRLYTALLEASASEHAARRRAMKAATDNAEELIRVLTRNANQARQAEITTEISEIVGGAEALSESNEKG